MKQEVMFMLRKIILITIAVILIAASANVSHAGDEALWTSVTTPDVLIVFDLSGSMASSPSGDNRNYFADKDTSVTPNIECAKNWSATQGTKSYCRKIDIAKYALFSLLNDSNIDGLNQINSADSTSLGVRMGLMRFYNCDQNTSTYGYDNSSSCIRLSWPITSDAQTTPTPYASIYCNAGTCNSPSRTTNNSPNTLQEYILGYTAAGGTPIGYSLREAKRYLDAHKAADDSKSCRQKSVIIVTDGADTYTCGGDGSSTNIPQRTSPVYYANQLAVAGYNVYVVGFGDTMTAQDKNELNWMAYYGNTRNPRAVGGQTGDVSKVKVCSDPCGGGTTTCTSHDWRGNCTAWSTSYSCTDPSLNSLSGYAFMASSPAELAAALRSAITSIVEANYSFSVAASVAAARIQDENFLYEASFEPKNTAGANKETFWTGHLKKYQLNYGTGELMYPACWDAGINLRDMPYTSRNMWTYKSGSMTRFDTTNMNDNDFGAAGTTCGTAVCQPVVGFYQGNPTYNQELYNGNIWKLGDLFHTNPMAVKKPSQFFYDPRECQAASFSAFRNYNERKVTDGKQLILVGANSDGQLHAIRSGSSTDCASGGDEVWSFIPPNLLQKMAPLAHISHADRSTMTGAHGFFIDGPIQVSDVWLPSTAGSGASKTCLSASNCDWKTIAILAEGLGSSGGYLWSNSPTCYSTSTSGFSATFSASYHYYCGIYALNITNTSATSPTYMWHLMPSTLQAPYLGEAWSKIQTGRVKIGGNERWVGFIGGGYNGISCSSADACDTTDGKSAGKGFFVVDLTNGNILWSFTHGAAATSTTSPDMNFSAPASPMPVDIDNDGFVDTVYMGDLGGNMWRFRLCPKDACSSCGRTDYTSTPCTSCDTSSWTGSLLFSSTDAERGSGLSPASDTHKQIFTSVIATKDTRGNVWVYFGTGENNDPTTKPTDTIDTKNRLYAIKEYSNFTGTPLNAAANLTNVNSTCYDPATATDNGWYINLSTNTLKRSDGTTIINPLGEKMISDPTIFNGIVYFPTYVPDQGNNTACGLAGDSFLYELDYLTGCPSIKAVTAAAYSAAYDAAYDAAYNAAILANPGDTEAAQAAGIAAGIAAGNAAAGAAVVSDSEKAKYIGKGIGSSVVLSYGLDYSAMNVYESSSSGTGKGPTKKMSNAAPTSSMTNILYWKDKRLQ
jgi:Tfp pilus tip-associated adhesin PilY1